MTSDFSWEATRAKAKQKLWFPRLWHQVLWNNCACPQRPPMAHQTCIQQESPADLRQALEERRFRFSVQLLQNHLDGLRSDDVSLVKKTTKFGSELGLAVMAVLLFPPVVALKAISAPLYSGLGRWHNMGCWRVFARYWLLRVWMVLGF